jgi:hypothetical protein
VEDSPGLDVGDGLFDDVADCVDVGVEGFLPVEEFSMGRFLDRCEHAVSHVSLVADPVGRVEGFAYREGVVAGSVERVGDPRQGAVQLAGDLGSSRSLCVCRSTAPGGRTRTSRAATYRR